jgi:hypothetical protein
MMPKSIRKNGFVRSPFILVINQDASELQELGTT